MQGDRQKLIAFLESAPKNYLKISLTSNSAKLVQSGELTNLQHFYSAFSESKLKQRHFSIASAAILCTT